MQTGRNDTSISYLTPDNPISSADEGTVSAHYTDARKGKLGHNSEITKQEERVVMVKMYISSRGPFRRAGTAGRSIQGPREMQDAVVSPLDDLSQLRDLGVGLLDRVQLPRFRHHRLADLLELCEHLLLVLLQQGVAVVSAFVDAVCARVCGKGGRVAVVVVDCVAVPAANAVVLSPSRTCEGREGWCAKPTVRVTSVIYCVYFAHHCTLSEPLHSTVEVAKKRRSTSPTSFEDHASTSTLQRVAQEQPLSTGNLNGPLRIFWSSW